MKKMTFALSLLICAFILFSPLGCGKKKLDNYNQLNKQKENKIYWDGIIYEEQYKTASKDKSVHRNHFLA